MRMAHRARFSCLFLALCLALAVLGTASRGISRPAVWGAMRCRGAGLAAADLSTAVPARDGGAGREALAIPVAKDVASLSIIRHAHYTIGYSTKWLQPAWVAYALEPEELKKNVPRQNSFTDDPLYLGREATSADYKNSGYSRGHLAPSADMRFSQQAMEECFYFTNVAPQFIAFNSGIWNSLEQKVRAWAAEFGTIFIATGPCFIGKPLDYIGRQRVPVPTHFYKALLMQRNNQWYGIAFLIPHRTHKGKVKQFACSIDQLEEAVQIDFFPQLPDSVEEPLEAQLQRAPWFN